MKAAKSDCFHNSHALVGLSICPITSQRTGDMSSIKLSGTKSLYCLDSLNRGNDLGQMSFLETDYTVITATNMRHADDTNFSGSLVRNKSISDLEFDVTRVGCLIS